jgi:hypothetical protein
MMAPLSSTQVFAMGHSKQSSAQEHVQLTTMRSSLCRSFSIGALAFTHESLPQMKKELQKCHSPATAASSEELQTHR